MEGSIAARSKPALTRSPDGTMDVRPTRERFVGVDRKVPLYGGGERTAVNFDNAATTPALRDVADGVAEFLEWYGSVHRGTGVKSLVSTHCYDRAREVIGEFVGADPDYHTVILTCSTTGAINKLARTLAGRGRPLVLCSLMEHHSNLLPWRECCEVDYVDVRPGDGGVDLGHLEEKLKEHGGRVRLVAVSGASNVTGLVPPVHRIARLAHDHGAEVFVDGAQLVPHRPVAMGPPNDPDSIDYIAFSGHKMYAPFGAGALVGPRRSFEDGVPDRVGGGTVKLVTRDTVLWADVPAREEPGTPNVVGAVALARAIGFLRGFGMDRIAANDRAMRARVVDVLRSIPGVRLFGDPAPDDHSHVGVVSFVAEKMGHSLLAAALGYEWGIAVRHGCFCAHPYIMRLLAVADDEVQEFLRRARENDHSDFPGLVRISLAAYNTPEEVEYLGEAIRTLLERGPRAEYVMDRPTGEFLPADRTYAAERWFRL